MDDAVVARGPDEPLGALARRLIPAGAELMSEPVEVELPALGRVAVILFRVKGSTNYTGWVLLPEQGRPRTYRRTTLPPVDLIDNLFDVEVKSVFAATVGQGPGRALCVLYWYYRWGSVVDKGHATEVYQWAGHGFERLDDAGDAAVGLATAGKVREKLKRWRPGASNP